MILPAPRVTFMDAGVSSKGVPLTRVIVDGQHLGNTIFKQDAPGIQNWLTSAWPTLVKRIRYKLKADARILEKHANLRVTVDPVYGIEKRIVTQRLPARTRRANPETIQVEVFFLHRFWSVFQRDSWIMVDPIGRKLLPGDNRDIRIWKKFEKLIDHTKYEITDTEEGFLKHRAYEEHFWNRTLRKKNGSHGFPQLIEALWTFRKPLAIAAEFVGVSYPTLNRAIYSKECSLRADHRPHVAQFLVAMKQFKTQTEALDAINAWYNRPIIEAEISATELRKSMRSTGPDAQEA